MHSHVIKLPIPEVLDVMSARSNGSCIRLKIFCRRSAVKGSAHRPIVPCMNSSSRTSKAYLAMQPGQKAAMAGRKKSKEYGVGPQMPNRANNNIHPQFQESVP